jgi:hypothetical protein
MVTQFKKDVAKSKVSQNFKIFSRMSIENFMDIEVKVNFKDIAVVLNMTFK